MLFHRFLVFELLLLFCVLYANGNESTFELSDSVYALPDVNLNEVKESDNLDPNSCQNSSWCWNGGTCDNGKCSCVPGTSGTFCEVVEGCEVNQKKCGDADNVFCVFNPTSGSPYCGCIDLDQRYDPYDQKCKECRCGHESRGTCDFEKGEKKCTCFEGNGISMDKYGKMDQCLPCSCGTHSHGCEYDADYRQNCFCDEGFAKTSFKCQECNCGPKGNCSLEYSYRKKCECEKGYKERDGNCTECDCGEDGECDWHDDDFGEKFCTCKTGYGVNNGICVGCDCYLGDDPVTCTFPDGIKKCSCPEGYEEINSSCVDINECLNETACPLYADCVNTQGSYECICRSGFRPIVEPSNSTESPEAEEQNEDGQQPVQRIIGCEDINECAETDLCIYNDTTTCINTPGSYICVCQTGFALPPGESSAQNGCIRVPVARDYTTLYTVLAALFGLIFIGVTGFFVFKMYRRR